MNPHDPCIIEPSLKLTLLYLKLGENDKASTGLDFYFDTQIKRVIPIFQPSIAKLSDEKVNEIALLGPVSNAYVW